MFCLIDQYMVFSPDVKRNYFINPSQLCIRKRGTIANKKLCRGHFKKKKKKENLAGSLFKKKIERFGVDIVSTNFPFLTPL